MARKIKILIVAGDPLARAALSAVCAGETAFEVMGLSSPLTAAAHLANLEEAGGIDLLIWDLGWEAGAGAKREFQEMDVPVLLLLSDPEQASDAWAAGSRAIVKRETPGQQLAAAAAAVCQGLFVLDPNLAASFLPAPLDTQDDLQDALTPRERQVLQLLAEGLTNKAIAEQLAISRHTVKFHVNAILGKLNAQSRTEAVVRATRAGLLAL